MDWKKTLATVAPGLATMLGGPLAGMATTAVMGHFGLDTTGDPDQDETAIAQRIMGMTPAEAIGLKTVEKDLAVELARADVDIYKTEVEDRKSARGMRAKLGGDWLLAVVAMLVVAGWILINYAIFTKIDNFPNEKIIIGSMRTLDAALMCVLYFLFGSSRGSQNKDKITGKQ